VGGPVRVRRLQVPALVAVGLTILTAVSGVTGGAALVLVGAGWFALAAVAGRAITTWWEGGRGRLARSGPTFAHLGIAVLLVGVGATAASRTSSGTLARGEQLTVGDLIVTNKGAYATGGDKPTVVADLTVQ